MDDNLKKYEYYRTDLGVLYHADCLQIMPHLEPVDLVLADPPYGLGKILHGGSWGTKDINWDNERPDVLELIKNIPNACVWGGNYFQLPISRGWLVWYKPDANGYIGKAELAWTTKEMPVQFISHSIAATNKERNAHPTIKPIRVIIWSLSFFNEQKLTLDPFLGSGTTAVACERLNRRWIGIEISEAYCKIAAERIERERSQRKFKGF